MQRITFWGRHSTINGFSFLLKLTRSSYKERVLLDRRHFTVNAWSWSHFPAENRNTARSCSSFSSPQRSLRIQPQYMSTHCPQPSDDDKKNRNKSHLSIPQKLVESCLPSVQPFLRLSRIHNPIGTWLLFWPCTWGMTLGAGGLPELYLLALFGTGAFIMRGAGCTVNDMWDKHIDAKVSRTANRPLASGELRMRHATGWLFIQLSLALSILFQLNAPCFIIGVGSLGLVCIYPLAKRVTNWPQAVLGLTFNTGVLMGFTAAHNSQLGYLTLPWLDPSCLSLYLAGISWTLIYDTIYAHQDLADDTTLGLGSTARRFGEDTKAWLTGFSCLMTSSLTAAGFFADLGWPYYAGVAAATSHLAWQIKTLDIHNVQNCSDRFNSNRHIGWIVFMSILGSFLMKEQKPSQTSKAVSASSIIINNSSSINTASILNVDKHAHSNSIVKNYPSLTNS